MMKFELDIKNGRIDIDNNIVSVLDETSFQSAKIFEYLNDKGRIKKSTPHHYIIDSVLWFDREFELIVRPVFNEKFPFTVQLIDKNGVYYSCINDWNKVSDVAMLNDEVNSLYKWLAEKMNVNKPATNEDHEVTWFFDWGTISTLYEIKSFNCGVFISLTKKNEEFSQA